MFEEESDLLRTKLTTKEMKVQEDKAENNGDEPSGEQVQNVEEVAGAAGNNKMSSDQEKATKIQDDEDVERPSNINDAINLMGGVQTQKADEYHKNAENIINESIGESGEALLHIAEFEETPSMQTAGAQLAKAKNIVPENNTSDANSNVQSANRHLSAGTSEIASEAFQDVKSQIQSDIDASSELANGANIVNDQADDVQNGEDADVFEADEVIME